MSPELMGGLLGAVAGAFTGALLSFWLNTVQDWLKIRRVSSKIRLVPESRVGSRVTARVVNDSNYTVRNAIAYVSVCHDLEEVMAPPLHFTAHINPDHLKLLKEDRLCWSATSPVRSPVSIDIYSGESQCLDIADFGSQTAWIELPSEAGYSSSQTSTEAQGSGAISSRIFLRANRIYSVEIRIVTADTRSRTFRIEIDASNREQPVRLAK